METFKVATKTKDVWHLYYGISNGLDLLLGVESYCTSAIIRIPLMLEFGKSTWGERDFVNRNIALRDYRTFCVRYALKKRPLSPFSPI